MYSASPFCPQFHQILYAGSGPRGEEIGWMHLKAFLDNINMGKFETLRKDDRKEFVLSRSKVQRLGTLWSADPIRAEILSVNSWNGPTQSVNGYLVSLSFKSKFSLHTFYSFISLSLDLYIDVFFLWFISLTPISYFPSFDLFVYYNVPSAICFSVRFFWLLHAWLRPWSKWQTALLAFPRPSWLPLKQTTTIDYSIFATSLVMPMKWIANSPQRVWLPLKQTTTSDYNILRTPWLRPWSE